MIKKFRQTSREDETYAAPFVCMSCNKGWIEGGHHYSQPFRFCPHCGIEFEGELKRSEEGERRRELRNEAEWKSHELAKGRAIGYQIERLPDYDSARWEREDFYYIPLGDRDRALYEWKYRLSKGSNFGEHVRLVAWLPGERKKVVLGPIYLQPDTRKD